MTSISEKYPRDTYNDHHQRQNDQQIVVDDSFERMGGYRYFGILDFDEFLMPLEGKTIKEMMVFEPAHDKNQQNDVRPAKTQISLGIRPVWSESSLCAQWVAKDEGFFMRTWKTLTRLSDAHADLSLCWSRRSFRWVCPAQANFSLYMFIFLILNCWKITSENVNIFAMSRNSALPWWGNKDYTLIVWIPSLIEGFVARIIELK